MDHSKALADAFDKGADAFNPNLKPGRLCPYKSHLFITEWLKGWYDTARRWREQTDAP